MHYVLMKLKLILGNRAITQEIQYSLEISKGALTLIDLLDNTQRHRTKNT